MKDPCNFWARILRTWARAGSTPEPLRACWAVLAANKQATVKRSRAFARAASQYLCDIALASCLTHRSTFAQTQLPLHRPGVSVVAVSTCQLVAAAVVAVVDNQRTATRRVSRVGIFARAYSPWCACDNLRLRAATEPSDFSVFARHKRLYSRWCRQTPQHELRPASLGKVWKTIMTVEGCLQGRNVAEADKDGYLQRSTFRSS